MTPAEFVEKAVGLPWVKWRSDFDGLDCFGLAVLYHREVLGIELGAVPQLEIADGFARATGWRECESGVLFMAFKGEQAVHCGIILPWGDVIHSEGSDDQAGNVRVSPLRTIRRMYGPLRRLEYVGHR